MRECKRDLGSNEPKIKKQQKNETDEDGDLRLSNKSGNCENTKKLRNKHQEIIMKNNKFNFTWCPIILINIKK